MSRFLCYLTIVAVLPLVGCSQDPAHAARAHVERGNRLLNEQNLQAASVEFRNAIELDANLGPARLGLARTYAQMNDWRRARVEFVRAADLMPADVSAQLAAAQALLRNSEFQDAKARAARASALDPKNLEAFLISGSASAGLRDFGEAAKTFEEALIANPSRPELLMNLGSVQVRRGQDPEAEAYFKQAISVSPDSVTPRLALANYYSSIGRAADAENAITEALKIDEGSVAANNAYAALLFATGRASEAEAPLRRAADASGAAEQRLRVADYYVGQKRQPEALPILKDLAARPEAFAAATSRLAAIEYEAGQRERGYALLEEVLTKQPANADVLVVKSRWLLDEQRFDEALASAEAAARANGTLWSAHEALGAARSGKRLVAEAIASYTEAIRLNPNALYSQIALSELHLARGDTDVAVRFAEDAARSAPTSGLARMTLVSALLARNDVQRANSEMQPLLAAAPDHPLVQTLQGQIEAKRGNTQVARAAFEKANTANLTSTASLIGLLRLDLAANEHAKAVKRVEEYIAGAPNDPRGFYIAGRTYAGVGDVDKAISATKKAIDLDASYMEAYALLGQLYVRQKKLREARGEYERMVAQRPDNVSAMTMIGMLLQAEGNHGEARKVYERILDIDGRAVVAANNLAYMQVLENGNLDRALDLAQRAKAGRPDDPDVNDTLGWIYYKRGMMTLAVEHLEQSVKANPENATYNYHLGLAHAKAGDRDKARAALERALRLQPNGEEAAEARKVLAGF